MPGRLPGDLLPSKHTSDHSRDACMARTHSREYNRWPRRGETLTQRAILELTAPPNMIATVKER